MTTGNIHIDQCVDTLCKHGCRAVRGYIEALRAGEDLSQFAGLDAAERGLLRQELESIMAVYGDSCQI